MLVTAGGDADAAYRMARCLQLKYQRVILYVPGYCKSSGTLLATGAHELVISDYGELGPLDVQMPKRDEIWELQSGLDVLDTLDALQDNAFKAFNSIFIKTKAHTGGTVTLKTASEIATSMATGLFSPLYAQVDPLHIGEAARAMSIAGHYGQRLLEEGKNIDRGNLDIIMSRYPSHGFVIDRREAESLFDNVRGPSPLEIQLAEAGGGEARWPWFPSRSERCIFLSSELPSSPITEASTEENHDGQETRAEGPGHGETAGRAGEESPQGNSGQQPVQEPDPAPQA